MSFSFFKKTFSSFVFLGFCLFPGRSFPLPKFQLEDQYGKKTTTDELKGKPLLLLGCRLRDVELCRKHGRKIYWKLQNLLWTDAEKFTFQSYLSWNETNFAVEKYIQESKERKFEPVLLDRTGIFLPKLKEGQSLLELYDSQGKEVWKMYLESVDDKEIQDIHAQLRKQI